MESKKYTIVCVDDERNILRAIRRVFRKANYNIITCISAKECLNVLEKGHNVNLIISDQRMPEMSGIELFSIVKEKYPDIIRILLTGYTDAESIKEAINRGSVYKIFFKPWDDDVLRLEVENAVKQYELVRSNRELTEKIIEQNERLNKMNEELELKVKERTRDLKIYIEGLEVSQSILEHIPVPVVGISRNGLLVYMNSSANHIIGSNKVGKNLRDCFEKGIIDFMVKAMKEQKENSTEMNIGSQRYRAHISIMSSRSSNGGGIILTLIPFE